MPREIHDELNLWRCPLLGGGVPFRHCRATNDGLPCGRMPECWGRRVDVAAFLQENYSPDELKTIFAPAPKRLDTIIETVKKFSEKK